LADALQSAQIEYALVRSRTESPADPVIEPQRQRIRLVRAKMAAMAAASPVPATLSSVATGAAVWAPTHSVPAGGVAAWSVPDASHAPIADLAPGLAVVVESRIGAWALVRAVNGWRGWVDARLLVERS
jgi:hypothetical protein